MKNIDQYSTTLPPLNVGKYCSGPRVWEFAPPEASSRLRLMGLFALATVINVHGQATTEGEAIVLSPFAISSTSDVGYQATSSLAGTRLDAKLRDLGSSISVVDQEFIKDSATTSFFTSLHDGNFNPILPLTCRPTRDLGKALCFTRV
jgi:hypothetical protein